MAVVSYIRKCTDTQKVDKSLIRHFVTEVGQIIESPYCVSAVQRLISFFYCRYWTLSHRHILMNM